MWGDLGDDELRGGPGEDVMAGEEGTDEHFGGGGGDDNDFIDAAEGDSNEDPADLVDCGSGFDTALALPNDIVRGNCENVSGRTTITTAPDSGTTAEEQQQQAAEAFVQENGLQS